MAGLLPLARMVEAMWENKEDIATRVSTSRRFLYNRCLLTALVDRWRPETHTFHLPCGEMMPTLQNVGYLTGLPRTSFSMAAYDVPDTWRTDILGRFLERTRRVIQLTSCRRSTIVEDRAVQGWGVSQLTQHPFRLLTSVGYLGRRSL